MDIGAWLRSLGLDHYERAFRDNDIDAQVLPDLTADDLTGLGVVSIGHRRKLLAAIAALRADPAVPQITPGLAGLAPDPPLAAAIRHAEAERRQLTVMFVDLVGSTAISTRLDPEEMREVLRAYQVAVAHEVMRFEGHIAKYMGDGVLAYFGWPRAHEDEAERAARAALVIIEAVSQLKALDDAPLACRIGIATGLVVVGDLVGEGPAQEEAVVGETPNLAARLQQVAQPGTVMIAQATRHLLEGLFDFEELDALALKGLPGSTRAYWLIGAAAAESRFEARHARRGIPLVGREQELALLLERWEQAKSGEGQVVLLLGEPGIGKSRIALALREQSARERRISLRYYGSSYHSDTALRPVIEQLERAAGFARDDTPTAKLDKLEALLAKADDPKVAAPVLAELLGLPTDVRYPPLDMTPPVLRARTLELLLAQCLGLARQQPVLVILEDAHWLDPTTRELFDRLVERVHSLPVLLLVTTRREFVPPWTDYAHVTLMSLNRLSTRQAETVVEGVSGGKPLPREVLGQILAKTDGVPLFVEELTRAVLESDLLRDTPDGYVLEGPLPALAIPATLHESLMARLDRLHSVKELAQTAACVGRTFTSELVAAVSDLDITVVNEGLDKLVAAELVHARGVDKAAGYAFKHALVQELARGSLLKSRRRDLHRRIAAAIEALHPEEAQHEPEILAYHYEEAELHPRAATYRLEAGRLAKARHAVPEATAHLEACLRPPAGANIPSSEARRLQHVQREAWLMLGDLASLADDLDRANTCYDRALALADGEAERRTICNKHHRLAYTTRDGARLAYYEHGSGAPTIVFVNPIIYGLASFQPLLEQLCQEFRIITVDCRGAGRSDALKRPYGIVDHAEDLRAVIVAAGAAPIVGVGISRGSNQLLHLAHKHPELVAKLIIIGTPTGSATLDGRTFFDPDYVRRRAEAYQREDVEALIRLQAEVVYSEENAAELRRLAVERCQALPRETILSFFDPDPGMSVEPMLSSAGVPTLVAHGRDDRLNAFAASEYIAARLPGARLYAFEGKGHNPMFSAAEEFCQVLRQFVRTGGVSARMREVA